MADKSLSIKLKLLSSGKILKVDNNKIAISKLFENNLKDKGLLQKDLLEIGRRVAYRIAENIYEKKRPDGKPQQRNSQEWIDAKGFDHPVLETGKLLKSIKAIQEGKNVIVRIADTRYPMRTEKRKNIKNRVLTSYSKPTRKRPKVKDVAKWLEEKGYFFFGVKKGFYQQAIKDTVMKRIEGSRKAGEPYKTPFSKLAS